MNILQTLLDALAISAVLGKIAICGDMATGATVILGRGLI